MSTLIKIQGNKRNRITLQKIPICSISRRISLKRLYRRYLNCQKVKLIKSQIKDQVGKARLISKLAEGFKRNKMEMVRKGLHSDEVAQCTPWIARLIWRKRMDIQLSSRQMEASLIYMSTMWRRANPNKIKLDQRGKQMPSKSRKSLPKEQQLMPIWRTEDPMDQAIYNWRRVYQWQVWISKIRNHNKHRQRSLLGSKIRTSQIPANVKSGNLNHQVYGCRNEAPHLSNSRISWIKII